MWIWRLYKMSRPVPMNGEYGGGVASVVVRFANVPHPPSGLSCVSIVPVSTPSLAAFSAPRLARGLLTFCAHSLAVRQSASR